MIVKFFLRNLFFFILLNITHQEGLEIEKPEENPYKKVLNKIKIETRALYEKLQDCVKKSLINIPVAGTTEIEDLCIGENFIILNKMHYTKVQQAEKIYEEMLWKEFDLHIEDYEDVIIYFIDTFKLLLKKGYTQLYQSMEIIQLGSKYFVEEKSFEMLLEQSKKMLEFISDFHLSFAKEKIEIKNFIKEELEARDANLEAILKASITGENLDLDLNDLNKKKTLADEINDMNDKINEETKGFIDEEEEDNNETGDIPEDFGLKGKKGDNEGFIEFGEGDGNESDNEEGGEQEDFQAESGEEKIDDEEKPQKEYFDEEEEPDTSEPPLNLVDDLYQNEREYEFTNFIY